MSNSPAIVLLSGGLDSTTCLAIARADGFEPVALSFRYGQRHAVELDAAARIATRADVEHIVVDIDLAKIGGSALTDRSIEVPTYDDADELGSESSIPATYVPARNTIMLSYGLAVAEVHGAGDIYIGVNSVDYSGYPDCRPEFIEAFQHVADVATRAAVTSEPMSIRAPLMGLSKAQIIRSGLELGVDYSLTTSCYDPGAQGTPCGRCDSCILRARGFAEVGIGDPALTTRRVGEP